MTKMKLGKISIFMISLLAMRAASAQTLYDIESLRKTQEVTSPTAWSFLKFEENPVNLYSGTPGVSVDLYTLKDGMASIPIQLKYNAAGIKVNELASWVGLGWNLSAGGVITQVINGKEDHADYEYSDYLGFSPPGGSDYWTSNNQSINIESFYQNARDGRYNPDLFIFNFMGHNGKFYIDHRTNEMHFVGRNRDNLKIEPLTGLYYSNYDGWKVTLPDGAVLTFEEQELMETNFSSADLYSSISFYLSRVLYPDGSYINFNYTSTSEVDKFTGVSQQQYYLHQDLGNVSSSSLLLQGWADHQVIPKQTMTMDNYTPTYLSSIETNNYDITFTTSTRTDIENTRKLDGVSISDKGNLQTRSFSFGYGYFQADPSGTSVLDVVNPNVNQSIDHTQRLKLTSVTDNDGNTHEFNYEETHALAKIGSFAQDHWGYYNGRDNEHFIPNLSSLSISTVEQMSTVSLQAPTYRPARLKWAANRNADPSYAISGMLSSIEYPTGGSREFTFESNEFLNYSIPAADYQRFNYIITDSPLQDSNDYEGSSVDDVRLDLPPGTQNASVDLDLSFSIGQVCGTGATATTARNTHIDVLLNGKVQIRGGTYGTQVYHEWTIDPADYGHDYDQFENFNEISTSVSFDPAWVTPFVYVEMPNLTPLQVMANCGTTGNYGFKIAASVSMKVDNGLFEATSANPSKGGGVRIQRIEDFDANNTKVKEREFDYEDGILHAPLAYISRESNMSVDVRQAGNCGTECGFNNNQAVDLYTLNSASNINVVNKRFDVGYSTVTERLLGSGSNLGRTISTFYNTADNLAIQRVPLFIREDNGLLKRREARNLLGSVRERKEYVYSRVTDTSLPNQYFGVVGFDRWMGPENYLCPLSSEPSCCLIGSNFTCTAPVFFDRFANRLTAYYFNLQSERWDLTTLTQTTFEGRQSIVLVKDYSYNALGQLIEEDEYLNQSPSENRRIVYQFPYDLQSSGNAYEQMVTDNFHELIQVEKYDKTLKTGSTTSTFQSQSFTIDESAFSSYYPTQVDVSPSGTSTIQSTGLVFSNGKLVELTDHSGIVTSMRWGGNRLLGTAVNAGVASLNFVYASCAEDWDCVRLNLSDSQVSNYEYEPLSGPSRMTDLNGNSTHYSYDNLGRLETIKDLDLKILKHYQYYIQGQ